jgi:tight adherence protein B
MLLVFVVFLLGAGLVVGGYLLIGQVPGMLAQRKLAQRLQDVSVPAGAAEEGTTVVMREHEGPLPELDRALSKTIAGSRLAKLIEQSGVRTTPGGLILISIVAGAGAGLITSLFARDVAISIAAALIAGSVPTFYILNRRSRRMHKFEEQFPEALDLLSRALRAGHAFQTSLGMVGDEVKPPVGPEFKKAFDQQNFGLPLRDVLNQLAERVPILDVRFFVTAVLIQRETGGNLSEILDNLAHVVRERFKVLRQVRVHTAHGRFTAFVLLSLPPVLAAAMTMLNREHMDPLFHERMGTTMLLGALVMQTIGFFWIRKVIKIEV